MSLIGALLFAKAVATIAVPPSDSLSSESCDFGEIYAFSRTTCQLEFGNDSETSLKVFAIAPSLAADSAASSELTVSAHSKAYLPVQIDAGNAVGGAKHRFSFKYRDASGEHDGLAIAYGFVMSALDEPSPEVDFGIVDLGSKQLPEKSVRLTSRESASFRITSVIDKPAWIEAAVSDDGSAVRIRLLDTAPLGRRAQYVKLAIDSPRQKEAWVSVTADLRGRVVPAINPVDLGLMRVGDNNQFRVPLKSSDGKSVRIGKVSLDGIKGSYSVKSCEPADAGCRWLEVTISKDQPLGGIKGNLEIELPDEGKDLRVAVTGLMVRDDFKVKSVDAADLAKVSAAAGGSASTSANSGVPQLAQAIKQSIAHKAESEPLPGTGPLLKWTVSNARVIYGFQIFRAATSDGPFLLQNVPVLRAHVADDDPTSFQWRDNSAEHGKVYWYYVGTVDSSGRKAALMAPQRVVAK
jgi:hypothetical protein